MKDRRERELKDGDVVNINQTVNGSRYFVVLKQDPLDIRYSFDLTRLYEYDKEDLLAPCEFTGEVDWEIEDNVYNYLLAFQNFNDLTKMIT